MAKLFQIFGAILIWTTVSSAYESLFKKSGCYVYKSVVLSSKRISRPDNTSIHICTNNKPLKPRRILEHEKQLCGKIGYDVCRSTSKVFNTLIWKETKSGVPNGCFGFLFGENLKKSGGYGRSCSKNHYLDGVLCCPKSSNNDKKSQNPQTGSKGKFRRIKKSHLVTNLVY